MPEKAKLKAPATHKDVEKRMQETVVAWYRGERTVRVYTTNNSDICLLRRRRWKELTGREAEQALPYLVFVLPRSAVSFRSKRKGK